MGRAKPQETRERYRHFLTIPTRWMDNDLYGHVNNVVYYSYIDTIANRYLITHGGFDIEGDDVIGVAVESHCEYLEPLAFPDVIDAGLRVSHLGTSSVRYDIGLFKSGEYNAAAVAYFVHVFVDRETRKPVAIPPALRRALQEIAV